jgi:hypothetical protein
MLKQELIQGCITIYVVVHNIGVVYHARFISSFMSVYPLRTVSLDSPQQEILKILLHTREAITSTTTITITAAITIIFPFVSRNV